jgi:hypothetical protein
MKTVVRKCLLVVLIVLLCGLVTHAAAEDKAVSILAPWDAEGRVFWVGPELLQFIGTFSGIMYIESGADELNTAFFNCPSTQEINSSTGETNAHGRCRIVDRKGNNVFAEFQCKGEIGGCQGPFTLTGGTGTFEGIKGAGEMVLRSVLGKTALDLESGSTIEKATGLAVWPEMKYSLPAK